MNFYDRKAVVRASFCLIAWIALAAPRAAATTTPHCAGPNDFDAAVLSDPDDDSQAFTATFDGHELEAVLLDPAQEEGLITVDLEETITVRRIAHLYCSNSPGVYADAATRADAHVLVALVVQADGKRVIKVYRLDLEN